MINLENEISFDPKSLPEPVCISWIVTSYLQARIVSNWYFLCHLLWGSMNRAIETKADHEDPPIHNESGSRNISTKGPRCVDYQPNFIWSATVTPPTLNLLEPDQGKFNTRKLSLPRKEIFRSTLWSQLWECHLISTLRMSPADRLLLAGHGAAGHVEKPHRRLRVHSEMQEERHRLSREQGKS